MFGGYRKKKFRDDEYDSSDMEANFDEIQREDKESRRIGRIEDQRELERIQRDEERRHKKKKIKS